MSEKKDEKRQIDFNEVLRTVNDTPITDRGGKLRLGRVAVDSLLTVARRQDQTNGDASAEDKLRCDQLARTILNVEDEVEAAPYNVLALPQVVVDRIDRAIGESHYIASVCAAAHRALGFEEEVAFEGIEVVRSPKVDEVEQDDDAGEVEEKARRVLPEVDRGDAKQFHEGVEVEEGEKEAA